MFVKCHANGNGEDVFVHLEYIEMEVIITAEMNT
jgi:cold shock CspA family protein